MRRSLSVVFTRENHESKVENLASREIIDQKEEVERLRVEPHGSDVKSRRRRRRTRTHTEAEE